jgi:hypothetical protein
MDYNTMNIIELLEKNSKESVNIEFKKTLYLNANKSGFLKDIAALANAQTKEHKFIFMGIKANSNGLDIEGIDETEIKDSSVYTNWVLEYIEPEIKLELNTINYKEKVIYYIQVISRFEEGPFIMKKKFQSDKDSFYSGDLYIRKSTSNAKMNKHDLDLVYKNKGKLEIFSHNPYLYVNDKGEAFLELAIRNTLDISFSFEAVFLAIFDKNGQRLYVSKMYGIEKDNKVIKGSNNLDFHLTIPARVEYHTSAIFSFTSSDAVSLNIDIDGNSSFDLTFLLRFRHIDLEDIEFTFSNCHVLVRGDNVLRKVIARSIKKQKT